MVRKSLLDKFIRLGGYQIVKKTEDGKWKNTAEASRKTGISRPAISRLLGEHPEPPIKQLLLSKENYEKIRESHSQIQDVSKAFERIQTRLANSRAFVSGVRLRLISFLRCWFCQVFGNGESM
jgi:hypothetical protein